MQTNGGNNCFIPLKDHNENLQNNSTVRPINTAKNEFEKISKLILDRINKNIGKNLLLNQWKNANTVIDWFITIQEKDLQSYVIFYITDFYQSVKEKLLIKALKLAETYTSISTEDKRIVNHSRKSLLFNNHPAWIKKGSGLFAVTIGAYDGAKVCELVGSFLIHQLSKKFNKKDIDLYGDDGLAVFKNKCDPQAQRIKKDLQKVCRENN